MQIIKVTDDLFSTAVLRVRQPVGVMLNWLILKAGKAKFAKVFNAFG